MPDPAATTAAASSAPSAAGIAGTEAAAASASGTAANEATAGGRAGTAVDGATAGGGAAVTEAPAGNGTGPAATEAAAALASGTAVNEATARAAAGTAATEATPTESATGTAARTAADTGGDSPAGSTPAPATLAAEEPAPVIAPQPGIMQIALYQAGAAHVAGRSDAVKLSSNENPLGCSPAARDAILRSAASAHRYPSSDHAGLRQAIGEVHGLDPARIICGAGSDEIISFLAQAYAGPGTEVLFTEHGFLMYRIAAQAAGATPVAVAERERVTDVDALIAGATPATRLVFVANPNNPTGTMIATAELERLARAIPQAIVVIDAAYAEYVAGYDGGAGLAGRLPNVVMTRTFSKIHGLGGLRVGWAYGPQAVIDVLARMRGPFNVSAPALAAAEAAIRDTGFTDACRAETARLRAWLAEALAATGVPSDTSCANFILARFRDAATAEACDAALQAEGLIVRQVAGYGLPHCLRITIGTEADCRRLAEVVARFMAGRT